MVAMTILMVLVIIVILAAYTAMNHNASAPYIY